MRSKTLNLSFLIILIIFSSSALAQTAQVSGLVSDQQKAAIGNADVRIVDQATSVETRSQTNSDGYYVVPFLQPGHYKIFVHATGFDTAASDEFTLSIGQQLGLNFELRVGHVNENVTVSASGALLDTTSGAISQVIDQQTITELPLDGRNPAALMALAPGALDAAQTGGAISLPGVGSGSPNETAASVNGSRVGGVVYLLDGITHMNNYFQTANPFPNPDATQEFRVISNNFDAQYGYTAGAIVSIATRSGTNQWHGVGFEFLRNNVLNSRAYFTRIADPLKRNQFGGSVGGPIKKDKLFVFGNVQFTRQRVSASSSGSRVPNNNELAGDFSQICGTGFTNGICNDRDTAGNVTNQIYKSWNDHSIANAYLNNQVNPATFAPFSLNLEKGLPKSDAANGLVTVVAIPEVTNVYEYTTRIDYNLTPSQVLSGRTFYDNYNGLPYTGDNYLAINGNNRSDQDQVLNISIGHIWTITPNLVNDLRGGYNKNNSQALPQGTAVGGGPFTYKALGSNLNVEDGFGRLQTNGFTVAANPNIQGRHNWIVNDTVSISKGKQTIAAGFNFNSQYGLETSTWEGNPISYFSGSVTGDADTDFLLGLVNIVDSSGGEYNLYTSKNYAAFAQDSIKLSPQLSINLGLRWEPQIAPVSILGHTAVFYPGQQSTRYVNAPTGEVFPGDAGVPAGGWASKYDTLLPRVSLAWAPKPATTVRAAFGLMALPYDYSFYNHQSENAPFSPLYVLQYNLVGNCTLNIADPYACFAPTNFQDPFPPYAGPDFKPGPDVAIVTPTNLQAVFTKGYTPAMEDTWNFSIQHAFRNDYLFTVAYIGRHDYHNPMPLELSPGIFYCITLGPDCTQADINANGTRRLAPNFQSVLSYVSIGVASYNGLQISAQKQLSHGLQFTSNYTWSKNLDNTSMASESNVGSVPDPFNPKSNYGISNLNTPQIWNNTFIYQTPKLAGLGRAASTFLGDWELAGAWQLHSGIPFNIFGGNNPIAIGAGDDNASYSQVGSDYADRVPGVPFHVHAGSKAQWLQEYFNTAAVTYNAPGTFGNLGRNPLTGPGWNNADLMFAKNFPIQERYSVQFRWEMFNAFNRTEFSTPNSDYNSASTSGFGQITGTAAAPRAMQAGLKINF